MEHVVSELAEYLPFWKQLTQEQRTLFVSATQQRRFERGTLLHGGAGDCVGLLLVLSGQLRVYTVSEEGKELTLYRLFERDMCLFSASCILSSIQFDLMVTAQVDTVAMHIQPDVYKQLMEQSAAVANYTNQLMATRFSDVMWLLDQTMHKKLDSRLAALLLEESELGGSDTLTLTHEQLGSHLGSPREVVTRLLKYFHSEGIVELGRGNVRIVDEEALRELARASLR